MFIFNFKKQFVPKILSGDKLFTIRANRKDGRRPENRTHLRFYTGMRTPNCQRIGDSVCVSVENIRMINSVYLQVVSPDKACFSAVYLEGRLLNDLEVRKLAVDDGFLTLDNFYNFFVPLKKSGPNKCCNEFNGFLIKWNFFILSWEDKNMSREEK